MRSTIGMHHVCLLYTSPCMTAIATKPAITRNQRWAIKVQVTLPAKPNEAIALHRLLHLGAHQKDHAHKPTTKL